MSLHIERKYWYRRKIISTLFSFFTLKEIAELTKVSRRFYRITGLKEVLDRFKNPSRLNDGEEIIKCWNVEEINNTFFFEGKLAHQAFLENKNANESDKHSYDIIADQYGNNYQFAAEQIISNNRSLDAMHSKSLNSWHKDKGTF